MPALAHGSNEPKRFTRIEFDAELLTYLVNIQEWGDYTLNVFCNAVEIQPRHWHSLPSAYIADKLSRDLKDWFEEQLVSTTRACIR
jgi:hypothetical protein